jgi:hypothetical protein
MASLSNEIAELIVVAHDLRTVNYVRGEFVSAGLIFMMSDDILAACLTWLFYDMVLTMDAEVKLACNSGFYAA